jgi:hypothetical protein
MFVGLPFRELSKFTRKLTRWKEKILIFSEYDLSCASIVVIAETREELGR